MAGEVRLPVMSIGISGDSRRFDAAAKRAARSTRNLQRRQQALRREMRRMQTTAAGYVRSIASVRTALVALVGGGAIGSFITNSTSLASELLRVANATGLTTEQIIAFQRVARDADIQTEVMNASLLKLTQRVGEADQGVIEAVKGFERMGIAIRNADGSMVSSEAVLRRFGQRLAELPSEAEKAAAIRFVFEEQSAAIAPVLAKMGDDFDGLIERSRELGTVTREQAEDAHKLRQAMLDLSASFRIQSVGTVSEFANPFRELIELIGTRLPIVLKGLGTAIETIVVPSLDYMTANFKQAVAAIGALTLANNLLIRSAFLVYASSMAAAWKAAFSGIKTGAVAAGGAFKGFGTIIAAESARISTHTRIVAASFKAMYAFVNMTRAVGASGMPSGFRAEGLALAGRARTLMFNLMKASALSASKAIGRVGIALVKLTGQGILNGLKLVALGIKGIAKAAFGLGKMAVSLAAPLAKMAVQFTVIATAFQLILNFDRTVANLVRFKDAFLDLADSIPIIGMAVRSVASAFEWMFEKVAQAFRWMKGVLSSLAQFLRRFSGEGGAISAGLDNVIEAFTPTEDATERLKRFGAAWKDLVLGIDDAGDAAKEVKLTLDQIIDKRGGIDVWSESVRRDLQERANAAKPIPVEIAPHMDEAAFSHAYQRVIEAQQAPIRELERQQRLNDIDARHAASNAGVANLGRIRAGQFGPQIDPQLLAQRQQQMEFDELNARLEARISKLRPIVDALQTGFEGFFESILDGTAKASDAFKALAADIIRAVARALIIQPIAANLTSGISSFFNLPAPAGRQLGGNVNAGSFALVGESGPEVAYFGRQAKILPNKSMMGSVSNSFSITIQSTDGPGVRAAMAEAMPVIDRRVTESVLDTLRRPGAQSV